jgi:hypothetical protein
VVEYSLEEGELGREFGEFGGNAIDDVSGGPAVRVYGVVMLLREVPLSKGKANYDCCKFHVGRLGANLGSVVKGEEDGAVLLPIGSLRDYGNPSVAGAVGGITLLLEYVEEVVACVIPSTINVDGVVSW